jgi:hypothetical protein
MKHAPNVKALWREQPAGNPPGCCSELCLDPISISVVCFLLYLQACRTVVSKAEGIVGGDNYCLNLRQFGLDRTYCLTDIATFCNR